MLKAYHTIPPTLKCTQSESCGLGFPHCIIVASFPHFFVHAKGVAMQGVFLTEALAEFQHVDCMIVRIWDVKENCMHAMLRLKLLPGFSSVSVRLRPGSWNQHTLQEETHESHQHSLSPTPSYITNST